MAQTVIRISCTDQTLKTIEAPVVSSGGVKENKVVFSFCPLWDGFTKTAVFQLNDDAPYQAVVASDNSCIIPAEALINSGKLHIGVYGVNADGIKRTTALLVYDIAQGAAEGIVPPEPTPDVYEQILEEIANIAIPTEIVNKVNGKTGDVQLTPEDIGAQPAGNYLIGETDPTVPGWAKQPTKPMYTASEVGAEARGAVNEHNTSEDAHYDIRQSIQTLQENFEKGQTNKVPDINDGDEGKVIKAIGGVYVLAPTQTIIPVTQAQYNALVANGNVDENAFYFITAEG